MLHQGALETTAFRARGYSPGPGEAAVSAAPGGGVAPRILRSVGELGPHSFIHSFGEGLM